MNKTFQILLFLFTSPFLFSQVQIGEDILGGGPNDDFGSGLAINEDGSIIAIGVQRYNSGQGIVEVYKNQSGHWELLGNVIEGPTDNAWFGTDLALNPEGNRIIIGSYRWNKTRIYDFDGNDWALTGEISFGSPSSVLHFGFAVDISQDGQTIAISATHYPQPHIHRGIVHIYRNLNDQWVQLGDGIEGESDKDQAGWDIDLSENGKTIAISSIGNDTGGEDAGQVRVFSFINDTWQQLGQTLNGAQEHVSFGWKISMSENGNYLIVGAPIDWTGMTTEFHYSEVFELSNGQWLRKGDKIYGMPGENFGYDVEINNDGDRVAITAPENETCPIQIYDFRNSKWELVGTIPHPTELHNIGLSIAMNPSGEVLVGTARSLSGIALAFTLEEFNSPTCSMEEPPNQSNTEPEPSDSLQLFVPNIISTNANYTKNAILYAQSNYEVNYSMKIYDRWGSLLFENTHATTNNITDGWSPNHEVLQGAYIYFIRVQDKGKESILTGDITLIK